MATERLISATAARAFVYAAIADPILQAAVNAVLDNLPAVDAVPVVRCKDCTNFSFCYNAEERGNYKEDFCSYGERNENM